MVLLSENLIPRVISEPIVSSTEESFQDHQTLLLRQCQLIINEWCQEAYLIDRLLNIVSVGDNSEEFVSLRDLHITLKQNHIQNLSELRQRMEILMNDDTQKLGIGDEDITVLEKSIASVGKSYGMAKRQILGQLAEVIPTTIF